eukprot:INCI5307.1.p1 GENE.INCI5307.1~~INCI5307.1.p1  ORF type:complete len:1432 (-),score=308.17 INCI5307.1:255-4550(-)
MRFADLEYAVSAASICPKGTIKLDASSELVLETEPYTFTLKCQNGMISLPLRADSKRRYKKWTQSIAKRLDEIKAIKKAMLEAAEKGTKKVEDPVKVFNQQKIISLLLACNIEVITETLDNFKSAGVTVAGDLTQFNTPESLDEAVDDITLEDARKLLKLFYGKMKEATAKKAALDAKAEPNNYMKQKNSLKLNAQNAGVSQEAEAVIAKNSNSQQDLSLLMGFKNVELEKSNLERQRKANAQRIHFKEAVDFSITFTDVKPVAGRNRKYEEYLFYVDTIAGSDAWSIQRDWVAFDTLNARLVKKFQKQGQRDVMPDFPKFEESSDLGVMQDDLGRYLVSLAASPLILTAHFFQNFVEDGRHSLVDKRPAALDADVLLPGIRDDLATQLAVADDADDTSDAPSTAAQVAKKKQAEEDFANFQIPADNAYLAQGHFRVSVTTHTIVQSPKKDRTAAEKMGGKGKPKGWKGRANGEKQANDAKSKEKDPKKKSKDDESSKVMYLELHVEDMWPPRRRKLSKKAKAAAAYKAKLNQTAENRSRAGSIGLGSSQKLKGMTIAEQKPGFQPPAGCIDMTEDFEGRITLATRQIESGRVPITLDGIFVKSKRLSKARGTDVWFKFSTKEAEEAAMKAAASAALEEAENEDGPIDYEEDTEEEKRFKQQNARWKFSLRMFKTAISPVIAQPQQEWDLRHNSVLEVDEDKEGNVVLTLRPENTGGDKLILKARYDDFREYWRSTMSRCINYLQQFEVRRIQSGGAFDHLIRRIERFSETRDRPQLYDINNKTVSRTNTCERCSSVFTDKAPADFCRCCGDPICFRCGVWKTIDAAFGGEIRQEYMCLVCHMLWFNKDFVLQLVEGSVMDQLADFEDNIESSSAAAGVIAALGGALPLQVSTSVAGASLTSPRAGISSPLGPNTAMAEAARLRALARIPAAATSPRASTSLKQMKQQLQQLKGAASPRTETVVVSDPEQKQRIVDLEEQLAKMALAKRTAEIMLARHIHRQNFNVSVRVALVKEVRRLRKLCHAQANMLISQQTRLKEQIRLHERELTRARLLYSRNLSNIRNAQVSARLVTNDLDVLDCEGNQSHRLRQRGNTWAPSRSGADIATRGLSASGSDESRSGLAVAGSSTAVGDENDPETWSSQRLRAASAASTSSSSLNSGHSGQVSPSSSATGLRTVVSNQLSQLERQYPQLAAFLRHPLVGERELLPALVASGIKRPQDLRDLPAHEVETLPQYASIPPDAAVKVVRFLPSWLGTGSAGGASRVDGGRGSADMSRVRHGASAPAFQLLQSALQSPGHAPPRESFERAWREIQIPPHVAKAMPLNSEYVQDALRSWTQESERIDRLNNWFAMVENGDLHNNPFAPRLVELLGVEAVVRFDNMSTLLDAQMCCSPCPAKRSACSYMHACGFTGGAAICDARGACPPAVGKS